MTRRFSWVLLLPCWFGLAVCGWCRMAESAGPPDAALVFRISGIVVSSRDGSPVARCKMSVAPEGAAVSPVGRAAGNRLGAVVRPMPGGRPGGRGPGGLARGGRDQGAAQTSQDSVITDATGHFSLTVPKAGMWRLTGVARGFRSQAYDEHEGYASSIVLTAAAPEMTLTFRLQPDASIAGVVFDEAGEPVRQAQVRVDLLAAPVAGRSARPGQTVGFAQTDDRGRYEIVALAQGQYRLGVSARPWYAEGGGNRVEGFRAGALSANSSTASSTGASLDPSLDMVYAQTWFPAATDEASAEIVDLKAGEERQADVHLTPIPAVHLLVPRNDPPPVAGEPRPARPPILSLNNAFGGFMGAQRVTTSGDQWDLGGLGPGTYQVRLPASGAGQGELVQVKVGPGSATMMSLQSATPLTKVTFNVDGVQDHTVESIGLTDVETGQTVPVLFRRGGRGQRLNPDSDDDDEDSGASHTVLIAAGTYEVSVTGNDGVFLAGLKAVGARAVGKTVEIAGGAPTLTIHAAAGRAEVAGIASKDGKPCVGAMVLLVPTTLGQPDSLAEVERDQTNTDGSFVLRDVIPGLYLLVAIDHGWDVNWHDAATLARYLGTATPLQLKSFAHVRQEIEATVP